MSNQDLNNNPGFLSPESLDSPLPAAGNLNSVGKSTALNSPPCSSCGNKRHSPDSPVYAAENPKRIFTQPEHNTPFDFSHITIPDFTQDNRIHSPSSLPVLRRCYSDPCSPPVSTSRIQIPMVQSPPLTSPVSKGTASLPPRPPVRRGLSDMSEYNKSISLNSSAKDSTVDGNSDSQLKNRMISCLKELNQWLNEMLAEREAILVTESEETVSVERSDNGLMVRLKCSCGKKFNMLLSGTECNNKLHLQCCRGKGFDILLSGTDCYYKIH